MAKLKGLKKSCRDVFNSFLVCFAFYSGVFEFPTLYPTYWVPNKLIAFSKALKSKDYDQWIHFYEEDYLFERVWRNPKRYLPLFLRFNGVVLPDFSVYRDMPFVMQLWNIYRSRAIGFWLQLNGVKVIPNLRWGDSRTFRCCCDGIEKCCNIAVGTLGVIKDRDDRKFFIEGLEVVVERLQPKAIIVYGDAPDAIFGKYANAGIQIIQFDSDCATARRRDE